MSKMSGHAKHTFAYSRALQKKDWTILQKKIPSAKPPEWERLSIAKADKYMQEICKQHGIDFFSEIQNNSLIN